LSIEVPEGSISTSTPNHGEVDIKAAIQHGRFDAFERQNSRADLPNVVQDQLLNNEGNEGKYLKEGLSKDNYYSVFTELSSKPLAM